MARGATPEESAVEAAAREWRHRAVHLFALVSAIAYLPPIVLMITGQAQPNGWPVHVILVGGYLSFVICALLPRTDYRARAWALLAGGYMVALIHLVIIPHGPFGRALPAMLPIMAFVLLGAFAGRVVTLVSIGLLLIGPLLGRVPGLVETLTLEPAQTPLSWGIIVDQASSLIALLVGQMILLDRFHAFLMRSLAGLQRETGERAAAYGNLEREMRERRRLESEVAGAADEERRRLGADLHDGVCQQLTGALLRCEAMARRLERGEPLNVEEFAPLSALLEESIDESRAVAKGLCPLDPDPEALETALQTLSKRTRESTGLFCQFTTAGDVRVPNPLKAQHLYRIAQEALSNAVRHANPTRIAVRLRGEDDGLVLEVEDNGKGMEFGAPTEGMGLRTMAYRMHLLEGELTVTPAPTGGTRVFCRVPASVTRPNGKPHGMETERHDN